MKRGEAAAILGVSVDASEAEIAAAFRSLVRKAHPDTGGAGAGIGRLTEARDVLLAPEPVSTKPPPAKRIVTADERHVHRPAPARTAPNDSGSKWLVKLVVAAGLMFVALVVAIGIIVALTTGGDDPVDTPPPAIIAEPGGADCILVDTARGDVAAVDCDQQGAQRVVRQVGATDSCDAELAAIIVGDQQWCLEPAD